MITATPDSFTVAIEAAGTEFQRRPIIVKAAKWGGEVPIIVPTLEGDSTCNPGSVIAVGILGEVYPVKPEAFESGYVLAETLEPVSLEMVPTITESDVRAVVMDEPHPKLSNIDEIIAWLVSIGAIPDPNQPPEEGPPVEPPIEPPLDDPII